MAACLGDVALATRLLDADPAAAAARVNQAGYAPVPPRDIYCWTLGFGMSPHDVALKFGHRDVRELLEARSPAPVRFLHAVIAGDEPAARALLDADASLLSSLTRAVHGHLAQAIFHGHDRVAELMLRLGFDETAPGVDGGTALHAACWVGNVGMVEMLLERGRVNVDARDPTHLSTPLGWAAFGSVHRRARAPITWPSWIGSSRPAQTSAHLETGRTRRYSPWPTGMALCKRRCDGTAFVSHKQFVWVTSSRLVATDAPTER
jgi:hypothetical protein